MTAIRALPTAATQPGVYTLSSAVASAVLRLDGERAGFHTTVIAVADITDKQSLLAAFARALHFPRHFGNNWDALLDCLRDLPAERPMLVLLDHPERFARAHPDDWHTARAILESAVRFWATTETPLYVVLVQQRRPVSS